MALGTITVQVNALTSNAYSSFTNVVIQAYYYCSSKLGEDIGLTSGAVGTDAVTSNDNEGIAVAMLAAAMLDNGKLHALPDGVPKTIDELFTDELQDMLFTPEEADETSIGKGVTWDNEPPNTFSDRWEVS
ncbi:hypothetical protein LCGC14_3158840 [marine sediment metagenome]|uniref:Uncharacterized protein n=1 Tax=marine sediment metagenome TaxID=412755 RepID=A0A0F8VRY7_9ZZZZ